jgi:predicted lipid-binding transport protein (Tim44 family)
MAEELDEDQKDDDHLPALNEPVAWWKAAVFFGILIAINIVGALVSYGFGIIATLPLTILMAFLIGRNMIPRHRFPPGRRPNPPATPA